MVKGAIIKSAPALEAESHACYFEHMPISLFPTPFPRDLYQRAKDLQPHLGVLLSEMVRQPSIIHETLAHFHKTDPFLRKLLDISMRFNALPPS